VDNCGICNIPTCPNCDGCGCNNLINRQIVVPRVYRVKTQYKKLKISEIDTIDKTFDLSIQGILSSLLEQKEVKTKGGNRLLSEFDFHDGDYQHLKLIFWGRLPTQIFKNRYSFNNIIIHGVKIKNYNGNKQLVVQHNAEVKILKSVSKSLEKFLYAVSITKSIEIEQKN